MTSYTKIISPKMYNLVVNRRHRTAAHRRSIKYDNTRDWDTTSLPTRDREQYFFKLRLKFPNGKKYLAINSINIIENLYFNFY